MENICQSLGKNSDKMVKGPFQSADGNGEFGKNRPALAISQMRWQSGPLWKWRFWRKWHILRKLRKSTSLRYKSKGDGKCGPLWKWRFWRKWHILRKLRKSTSLRYKSKGDGKCGPLWKWRFWLKWHIWRKLRKSTNHISQREKANVVPF